LIALDNNLTIIKTSQAGQDKVLPREVSILCSRDKAKKMENSIQTVKLLKRKKAE
jgi:hypothetical protein